MNSSTFPSKKTETTAKIALIGGGPGALVAAIAFARRGIRTEVNATTQSVGSAALLVMHPWSSPPLKKRSSF